MRYGKLAALALGATAALGLAACGSTHGKTDTITLTEPGGNVGTFGPIGRPTQSGIPTGSGFAVPLVVDRHFLHQSRDVFPMEFSDIKEQHRTLWGEEIFRTLAIGGEYLRILAEHEARGRLLRLQALYLERAGEPPRLRQILLDSLKTFLTLMRHLLRVQGKSGAQNYGEVLSLFEQHFQVSFPEMRRVIAIRQGVRDWPHEPATEFFREYLEDVRRLVSLIDGLPQQSTLSPRQ